MKCSFPHLGPLGLQLDGPPGVLQSQVVLVQLEEHVAPVAVEQVVVGLPFDGVGVVQQRLVELALLQTGVSPLL